MKTYTGLKGWHLAINDDGTVAAIDTKGRVGGDIEIKPAGRLEQRLLHLLVQDIVKQVNDFPYAEEMTNGECADILQAFLNAAKENAAPILLAATLQAVERAVRVLANPPREPFICECKRSQKRE